MRVVGGDLAWAAALTGLKDRGSVDMGSELVDGAWLHTLRFFFFGRRFAYLGFGRDSFIRSHERSMIISLSHTVVPSPLLLEEPLFHYFLPHRQCEKGLIVWRFITRGRTSCDRVTGSSFPFFKKF